jgi:hypothetical protein
MTISCDSAMLVCSRSCIQGCFQFEVLSQSLLLKAETSLRFFYSQCQDSWLRDIMTHKLEAQKRHLFVQLSASVPIFDLEGGIPAGRTLFASRKSPRAELIIVRRNCLPASCSAKSPQLISSLVHTYIRRAGKPSGPTKFEEDWLLGASAQDTKKVARGKTVTG